MDNGETEKQVRPWCEKPTEEMTSLDKMHHRTPSWNAAKETISRQCWHRWLCYSRCWQKYAKIVDDGVIEMSKNTGVILCWCFHVQVSPA